MITSHYTRSISNFHTGKECDLLNDVRPVVFNLEWREPVEEGGLCSSIKCGYSYFM